MAIIVISRRAALEADVDEGDPRALAVIDIALLIADISSQTIQVVITLVGLLGTAATFRVIWRLGWPSSVYWRPR